jgi:hypothetical protein
LGTAKSCTAIYLTEWVIFAPQEHRLNRAVTVGVVKNKLVSLSDLDQHLAKMIDGGCQQAAVAFAMDVVNECIVANCFVSIS